jgi:hypothetical protein
MEGRVAMKRLGYAAIGIVAIFALPGVATAAVVCNDDGDCWRVKEKHTYPPDVNIQVYDDDWVLDTKKYRWRDPGAGRGYYRGGLWVGF